MRTHKRKACRGTKESARGTKFQCFGQLEGCLGRLMSGGNCRTTTSGKRSSRAPLTSRSESCSPPSKRTAVALAFARGRGSPASYWPTQLSWTYLERNQRDAMSVDQTGLMQSLWCRSGRMHCRCFVREQPKRWHVGASNRADDISLVPQTGVGRTRRRSPGG